MLKNHERFTNPAYKLYNGADINVNAKKFPALLRDKRILFSEAIENFPGIFYNIYSVLRFDAKDERAEAAPAASAKMRSRKYKESNMLTIEALRQYGANVDEALERCLKNEGFYLRLVEKAIESDKTEELASQLEKNDPEEAFRTAHAMKGVYANLALTPILGPIAAMTEILRKKTCAGCEAYIGEALAQKKKLKELLG